MVDWAQSTNLLIPVLRIYTKLHFEPLQVEFLSNRQVSPHTHNQMDWENWISSIQSFDRLGSREGGRGGHAGRFKGDPLLVFSARLPCEQFCHGQGCPLFVVVHRAFPLPTTASSTHQGALKDGFGEVVATCDRPEPWKVPSLDSYQKRFLWTHKQVDIASHPVVGLVLQVRDAEKFPQALGLESLDYFLGVSTGSMFHSHTEGWRWQETCRAWTSLQRWWCCTAKSCFYLLPLLRPCWCGLLLSRCNPCTGLLPSTWNWSPRLTSGRSIGHGLALFCADLHSTCRYSAYESIGEVCRP